ncbi:MAG: trigger factor [Candidatus Omnitrophota bacterium]|jgi:trigger factor
MRAMKTNLKKIKDCRHALDIEVGPELVEEAYQKAFKTIQKKIKMPGFRQGKVPLQMIEKDYESHAKEEVANALISSAYSRAIGEAAVKPMSQPTVTKVKFERGQKMTFLAEFDTPPTVKLKKYKGLKINRQSIEVGEEDIKTSLDGLLDNRAKLNPITEARPCRNGDVLEAEVEVQKEGKVVREKYKTPIPIQDRKDDDPFFKALLGCVVGDVKEIPFKDKFTYQVTVLEIKEKELPALDDAFAVSFGKKDMAELREEIRKDLARHFQQQSREGMRGQVFDKLIDDNHFSIPEDMVSRQKEVVFNETAAQVGGAEFAKQLPPDQRKQLEDTARKRADRQVRLHFILDQIAKEADLSLDDADIERRIHELSASTKKNPDEIRKDFMDDVKFELRQTQTVDHVIAAAVINDTDRVPQKK